ncbi:universal stress protein [Halorubrum sp. AS12]|uniref:universal stress protein n=1 Tax=Halorubrum sp. AS12 TaxID=3409687 RepID=UPI003DA6F6E7
MEDAFVAIDDVDQSADMLREAAAYAAGAGADLVLYHPLTPEQFEESQTALDEIGRRENKDYADEDARTVAKQFVDDVAREALADFDVEYTVVTDVTEEMEASRIIELAEKRGCDHVFTTGRRRSPTGKAMFGDTTQQLILNFSGFVTVRTD